MDKERICIKLDEIDQYLQEIEEIYAFFIWRLFSRFDAERLIQITIEAVMDVSAMLVKEMRLGLPYQEENFLDKISGPVLSPGLVMKTQENEGFPECVGTWILSNRC